MSMTSTMKVELKQHFRIEAARYLPALPKDHPCSRMHGHSFRLTLTLVGEIDAKLGWLRDYHEIQKKMAPLLKKLDHQTLNEVEGLNNPTSEYLAIWFFHRAKEVLPELVRVTVSETPDTECSYPTVS